MKLIAIGTSAGGTEALEFLLPLLTIDLPPVVIVHHMEEYYVQSFCERLDSMCNLKIQKAKADAELLPNTVLVSPGNLHLKVRKSDGRYYAVLSDEPPVQFQKPSVDVLFRSVADAAKNRAIGVILTGAGRDGADGICAIKKNGGRTIAQDESSSTVYGMPKAAYETGCTDIVSSLNLMPASIYGAVRK